jgi:putative transposase
VIRYIEAHRDRFGVEPICRVLQVAPSSYYAARSRRPSAHDVRDQELAAEVARVHAEQFGVYGTRKVWRQLAREHIAAGRDRVARLMRGLGLAGVRRERRPRTTQPVPVAQRPADLVERVFRSEAPNRLWVADITYVRLRSGFCYTALVVDAFSRRIVGWRVSLSLAAELTLDALDLALWARGHALEGLVHHSDRGIQYLALRYTERLAGAGAMASVGSRGDSYDNALAESVNALYKAELIHRQRWSTVEQVELATAGWVDWWNHRRLHSACGNVPPADFDAAHANRLEAITEAA